MKKWYVKTSRKEMIEPEEVIVDQVAASLREDEFHQSSRRFEVPLASLTFRIVFVGVSTVLAFLFFRVLYLQIGTHGAFVEKLEKNYRRLTPIQSLRGVMYGRNFVQLAENFSSFALVLNAADANEEESKILSHIEKIAGILNLDEEFLKEQWFGAQKNSPSFVLVPQLSHEEVLALGPQLSDMPEFAIEERYVRRYPYGPSQAHVLGYEGRVGRDDIARFGELYRTIDYVGKDGLELQYEDILRGDPGMKVKERDKKGRVRKEFIQKEPSSGKSLLLHLDSDLQNVAFEVIKKKLKEVGLSKGAFVAIDPRSGGVLSLISFPSFDPNVLISGISKKEYESLFLGKSKPLFNRAISGTYPSGSTIKPLIASAALEEKIINSSKLLYAPEAIFVQHPYQKDVVYRFADWKYHGWVSVIEAIAQSANTFFYQIGGGFENQKGLGIAKIKEYLLRFGWGKALGIDLPGESGGLIPDPEWKESNKNEMWYIGDTYNVSIGQGDIAVTPLQLTSAIGAIGIGGVLYQPQLADKILNESKEVVEDISPRILEQGFIDPKVIEVVRKGMYAVTQQGGTAGLLGLLPVKVGAKTGTAQAGRGVTPHAWLTAFAPLENPEIAITVLIENGGEVPSPATQTAYEILRWYFQRDKSLDTSN